MAKKRAVVQPKTILIGMPSYTGMIPAVTVQSMLQLHKPAACAFMTVERQRIDKARNACVLEALRTGADYLMFVDDDNPVPPDTLELMLADDKDIVAAPILGRVPDKAGRHALCAFYSSTVDVDGKPLRLYRNIETLRDAGPLHRVDAVGTGCMLIKRRVLEALFAKHRQRVRELGDLRLEKDNGGEGVI